MLMAQQLVVAHLESLMIKPSKLRECLLRRNFAEINLQIAY